MKQSKESSSEKVEHTAVNKDINNLPYNVSTSISINLFHNLQAKAGNQAVQNLLATTMI